MAMVDSFASGSATRNAACRSAVKVAMPQRRGGKFPISATWRTGGGEAWSLIVGSMVGCLQILRPRLGQHEGRLGACIEGDRATKEPALVCREGMACELAFAADNSKAGSLGCDHDQIGSASCRERVCQYV